MNGTSYVAPFYYLPSNNYTPPTPPQQQKTLPSPIQVQDNEDTTNSPKIDSQRVSMELPMKTEAIQTLLNKFFSAFFKDIYDLTIGQRTSSLVDQYEIQLTGSSLVETPKRHKIEGKIDESIDGSTYIEFTDVQTLEDDDDDDLPALETERKFEGSLLVKPDGEYEIQMVNRNVITLVAGKIAQYFLSWSEKGKFANNETSGTGTFTYKVLGHHEENETGVMVLDGQKVAFTRNDVATYEGSFKNHLCHGTGKITFRHNPKDEFEHVLEGLWVKNKREGLMLRSNPWGDQQLELYKNDVVCSIAGHPAAIDYSAEFLETSNVSLYGGVREITTISVISGKDTPTAVNEESGIISNFYSSQIRPIINNLSDVFNNNNNAKE